MERLSYNQKVRLFADDQQGHTLLPKLSDGNMTVIGAVYHNTCINRLHRQVAQARKAHPDDQASCSSHLIFEEVMSYIESFRDVQGTLTIFKTTDMCLLYKQNA